MLVTLQGWPLSVHRREEINGTYRTVNQREHVTDKLNLIDTLQGRKNTLFTGPGYRDKLFHPPVDTRRRDMDPVGEGDSGG